MDIPGLSGRLLFKHLLQLWISRGYLGKLQTPSTALDIPGLSTETSHTFYSSGYPGLIYGNFTHLLQLWISRGCLGDSSSNTFYSYEYPGVVWETPLQTPSTALDIPGLFRETSDTFYSSGYPGVIYGNFTHLLQLWISRGCLRKLHTPSTARASTDHCKGTPRNGPPVTKLKVVVQKGLLELWISRGCLGDSSSNTFYSYGYPGVAWETPLQTPSTALNIPGLSRETSDTFYSSGYPGVVYGNFTHLLQLWISRGCLRKLQTPSTALDIPGLSTETSHTFYSSGRLVRGGQTRPALITARVHAGMVHQSQKSRNPINPDKGRSTKALLQLWISRGCLGDSSSNNFYGYGYPGVVYGNFTQLLRLWISRALDIPGLSTETSHTFYSYGYPGVVWETPLQTPSTATNIQGLSGRLLFKHLLQLWISRGCLRKLHTPSTALDIPGLSTETSHTFYSSGRLVRGGHTRPALITARVHPGMVHQSQKSRNPINPDKGRSTKALLQLWISRGCLGDSSSNTFYSYGYPGVVWETPLQTPSTALNIPGLSRETSDTFYSSGYPGVVYGNFTHLLQLWISRGCLRKLQTPSTALDIPGLSTETSHTFYSSGRLVRGGQTRPALITARVHPGMVQQAQKSRNPINPDKGRSTKALLQLIIIIIYLPLSREALTKS
ncbi:hypothetical protein J6590_091200 [Homalodisca vitripennis]|nr:hypothetical protein J6590_091200 [Homalodisca vitripennis]